MAIAPASRGRMSWVENKTQDTKSTDSIDDADEAAKGNGIIDNTSEYASMSMLGASFVRQRGVRKEQEEWMGFAERILDEQADAKLVMVEQLLGKQFMSAEQMRALLARMFPDVSDMLMALSALISRYYLKKEKIDALKKIRQELLEKDTKRLAQSGANIALVAKAFAEQLGMLAGNLRSFYRKFLSYDGPSVYLYEQWVDSMESDERDKMMRYLSRALACDVRSLPLGNINISDFGMAFSRISQLRELQSIDNIFRDHYCHGENSLFLASDEKELSKLFIAGVRSNTLLLEKLNAVFTSKLREAPTDIRARFLQWTIIAFSSLPVAIFSSLEARAETIDILKMCMDYVKSKEWDMILNLSPKNSE